MKTKIGTVLDEKLLRQARSVAAREGKRLNQVLEVAARTAGTLRLARRHVDRILREEPGILGA